MSDEPRPSQDSRDSRSVPSRATLPLSLSRRSFAVGSVAAAASLTVRRARAESLADVAANELGALARWAQAKNVQLSACFMDAQTSAELAAVGAHEPLNPASTQKIVTMAGALDQLGADYCFVASLHGVATGDTVTPLVLRSNGHPTLSVADLEQLARSLPDQGIFHVAGDVCVDQSAFDQNWDPPAYDQHPNDTAAYRAPVSAVAVDGNTVTLHARPASEGATARVWFTPPALVSARGTLVTRAGSPNVRLSLEPHGEELWGALSGSLPEGPDLSVSRRLPEPSLAAGRVLRSVLQDHRVSFDGAVTLGGAGVEPVLASVASRPLGEIVHAMGKHSDNFVAEMLLKALGRAASGGPGTSADGARALTGFLQRLGALEPSTRITNGSGLFDANRLSAWTLCRVLGAAHRDPRIGPELVASLSIGGVDGTLHQRFAGLRAERRLRAKTGTLANVIALAGYVLRDPPEAPLVFAILLNRVSDHVESRRRMDSLVEAVARAATAR